MRSLRAVSKSGSLGSLVVTLACLMATAACSERGGGGGDAGVDSGAQDADLEPLRVVDQNPDDQQTGVPIDQTIRVVFSHDLDPTTVDTDSVTVTSGGEEAIGRVISNRQVMMFLPAELEPDSDVTVTISGDVSDTRGISLGEDHVLHFTTAGTTVDGTEPLDEGAVAPFKESRFVYLARRNEYVVLGADYDSSGKSLFVIDPLEFNQQEPGPTDEIMYARAETTLIGTFAKLARRANLDDDVADEVVVLLMPPSGPATLEVLDSTNGDFSFELINANLSVGSDPSSAYQHDMAVGDVDHDGYDEIVITARTSNGDARLWVFDDAKRGYALLRQMDLLGNYDGGSWTGMTGLQVAVGNFVKGPGEEIALAYFSLPGQNHMSLRFVKDLTDSYEELETHYLNFQKYGDPGEILRIAAGDLDGDQIDDLVLGRQYRLFDSGGNRCFLQGNAAPLLLSGDGEVQEGAAFSILDEISPVSSCDPPFVVPGYVLRTLDEDGDLLRKEVLAHNTLLRLDLSDPTLPRLLPTGNYLVMHNSGGHDAPMSVDVGDVNGDGLEDIVLLYPDSAIRVYGTEKVHVGYDLDMNPVYEYNWKLLDERGGGGASVIQQQIVASANFDGDSVAFEANPMDPDNPDPDPIRSNVEHRIVFSNDQILAVVAGPPCLQDIGQNLSACSTGLGISTGGSITAGASFSTFAGVSVGYELEVSTGAVVSYTAFSLSVKALMEVEAKVYGSLSVGFEQTIADFAGPGEDLVVFFTVPQHQYIYTFVSHPDPSMVGSKIYVNIPMRPRILAVSREYYNANNGAQQDIDESILPNVPGDLSTYPSLADVLQILGSHVPLGFTTPPVTVNEGSGFKELSLELSTEAMVGGELTITSQVEGEVCVEGTCAGIWTGASASVYAETRISSSMVFTSAVGAIDGEHWADNIFDYGLFAYLAAFSDPYGNPIQIFPLVNYYVD